MFTFYLDRHSKTPIYVQLYQFIRSEIEKGLLLPDAKLPSKRKLANHLQISQITVDAAYQQLMAEGYLRSVPRSGFYVEPYEQGCDFKVKPPREELIINFQTETYQFDFRTNVVDTFLFPNTTWAKLAREVLSENNYEMVNVTNPQGLYELREQISKYLYDYRGINAHPEQIIIGGGSDSLISLIILLLSRNSIYALENPGYHKVYQTLRNNNVPTIPIALDECGLKVSELEASRANIVHVTPSHQFPTGVIMPIRRRLELLNWANKHTDRYILEDDYDSEFRYNGQPIPALQGLDKANKVIYLNTFTKTIAPSLRISYLVLPINLLNKYKMNPYFYTCSVPNFDQYILSKFMQGGYFERHINRMRNVYKEKLKLLINQIQNTPLANIIKIYAHDAGLHFMMHVNNGMTEQELVETAKKAGVRVYGLSEYSHTKNFTINSSTVVIGYSSLSHEELIEAISRLKKAWL